jgi:hypothetical protein
MPAALPFEKGRVMNPAGACASSALALALFAAPAVAQDWLVSPAPLVPLHVPALTSPPPAGPPMPSSRVAVPEPREGVGRTPDPIRQMLDPYGLSTRPASVVRPSDVRAPLPSVTLPPDSALNGRPAPVAIVRLPLIPLAAWPLGL